MVLSETDNIGFGSTKQESPAQVQQMPPLPEEHDQDQTIMSNKDPSMSPLNGQNSLMSLTLNEIQLKSGKTFGSMNMDEFLTNLWNNVDDNNQLPSIQPSEPPLATAAAAEAAINITTTNNTSDQPGTLARQGSLSIPAPLCKKTVDEVWFEIQKDQPQNPKTDNIGAANVPPERQQTFGEMTLEDFLVKAGVVQEVNPPPPPGSSSKILTSFQDTSSSTPCLDSNFGLGHFMGLGMSTAAQQNVGNNNGFGAYQLFQNKGYNVGETSNDMGKGGDGSGDHSLIEMNVQQNKKRIIDGPPEVVVERRQRRMIKNRESAARSRARKQAYTVELELELNQLKEENAKLKQIVEEIENKRKQEVMKRKQPKISSKKMDRLKSIRRTVSLPW